MESSSRDADCTAAAGGSGAPAGPRKPRHRHEMCKGREYFREQLIVILTGTHKRRPMVLIGATYSPDLSYCAERWALPAWVSSRNMPPKVLGSHDDPSRHAKTAHLKVGTIDIERPIPVAAVAPGSSHFVGTSWTARVPERQCLGRFTATQQRGHSIYPTLEVRRLALGKPFENQATSRVWSQVFTQLRNPAWRKGCRTPFFAKVFRKNVFRKNFVRWGFRKVYLVGSGGILSNGYFLSAYRKFIRPQIRQPLSF